MTDAVQHIEQTSSSSIPNPGSHAVQFYESEGYLAGSVATFLASGFAQGRPGIVVATDWHRREIAKELRQRGFDLTYLQREHQLVMIDARQTLESFLVDGVPDESLFRATIEALVRRATLYSGGTRPQVFGEMVDLLWRDGQQSAAIQLETYWNAFGRDHEFDLLCAYGLNGFGTAADGPGLAEVCRQHTHVIPTERYTQVNADRKSVV